MNQTDGYTYVYSPTDKTFELSQASQTAKHDALVTQQLNTYNEAFNAQLADYAKRDLEADAISTFVNTVNDTLKQAPYNLNHNIYSYALKESKITITNNYGERSQTFSATSAATSAPETTTTTTEEPHHEETPRERRRPNIKVVQQAYAK